ncbi:MAG: glutamate--tRNA ligase [Patescibacteria group bacterium]
MPKKLKVQTKKIRVRFPPSPTGPLHIGGARTALFNYLFAKQNKGDFILRIEDTDKERSRLEWVQEIIDELKWLGIEWNEGPDIDGKFGPYKQSQRLDIYEKYLEGLLTENKAYYCICAPEELEARRQEQMSRGVVPKYDGKCRDKGYTSGVIRFRILEKKLKFDDLVRGRIEFDAGLLGDIVIAKNLENPLYHFAVVVDDYEMEISHVIRGEEHLSNTPRQILLQEAMGFYQPIYAHLPLILNPDKSKMSKRAGDMAVSDYHKNGYLPEAIVNFMAFLGWNPGTEKEIFSMSELIKEFSLGKVQKGGAVFNIQRLDYTNGVYIREKTPAKLLKLCLLYLPEDHKNFSEKTLEKIIEAVKTRMKKLSDVTELTDFFFKEKLEYDKNLLAWQTMGDGEVKESLERSYHTFKTFKKYITKDLEGVFFKEAENFNREKGHPIENRGYLLWPLRVALSGKQASTGPFEIAEILGKEKTLQRIQSAIDKV